MKNKGGEKTLEGEAVKLEFLSFVLSLLSMLERGEVEEEIKILRDIIKNYSD